MPIINRIPIHSDNSDDHDEALVKKQSRIDKKSETVRNYDLFSIRSTVAIQQEDGGPWSH